MYCYLSPKIALGIPFKRPAELQKTLTSHSGYVPSRTKYSFYCYLKKVFKQYYKWRLSVNIMFQKNNNHSNIHSFLLQHTSDVVYIHIILVVTNWRRHKWQILSNNKIYVKFILFFAYTSWSDANLINFDLEAESISAICIISHSISVSNFESNAPRNGYASVVMQMCSFQSIINVVCQGTYNSAHYGYVDRITQVFYIPYNSVFTAHINAEKNKNARYICNKWLAILFSWCGCDDKPLRFYSMNPTSL